MKKLGILSVTSLLFASSAFAVEPVQLAQPEITITVAGKTVTTLRMSDQPEGAEFKVTSTSGVIYDQEKGTTTATGECTVEVHKGSKRLFQIMVEDGVVRVDFKKNSK